MPQNDQTQGLIAAARRLPAGQRGALRAALGQLGGEAEGGAGSPAPRARALLDALRQALASDEAETLREDRLVAKLAEAGQLRSGFLIRALREGRLGLFEAALARLGGFERRAVRLAVMSEDRPELLALACAGVGIDQGAFPTILDLVRQLSGGRPGGGEEGARRAALGFGPFPPDRSASAFRQVVGAA